MPSVFLAPSIPRCEFDLVAADFSPPALVATPRRHYKSESLNIKVNEPTRQRTGREGGARKEFPGNTNPAKRDWRVCGTSIHKYASHSLPPLIGLMQQ